MNKLVFLVPYSILTLTDFCIKNDATIIPMLFDDSVSASCSYPSIAYFTTLLFKAVYSIQLLTFSIFREAVIYRLNWGGAKQTLLFKTYTCKSIKLCISTNKIASRHYHVKRKLTQNHRKITLTPKCNFRLLETIYHEILEINISKVKQLNWFNLLHLIKNINWIVCCAFQQSYS